MIVQAPVTHIKLVEYDPPEDAADRQVWDECVRARRQLEEADARVRAPAQRLRALQDALYERSDGGWWRTRKFMSDAANAYERGVDWLDTNVLHHTRDKALWWAIQRSIGTPREVQIRLTDWVEKSTYSTLGEAETDLRDEATRPMGENEP